MFEFLTEMRLELENHILPFWMNLHDKEFGGFYGRVDHEYNVLKTCPKGSILNSRILFSFSCSYNLFRYDNYLFYAKIAYEFLINKFLDYEYGGLFLIVDYKGNSLDDRKLVNNLCYAIYALAEYYQASNDITAKDLAISFFDIIESKKDDHGDYQEEFDRYWKKKQNEFLDRFSLHAEFSLDNLIHILESYTNLYKIWSNSHVYDQIKKLIIKLSGTLYSKINSSFNEFFNSEWTSLIDLKVYGHTMECAWLLQRSSELVEIQNEYIKYILEKIYMNIQTEALENNSIIYESLNGKKNLNRCSWVQTEAIIGFLLCYKIFGQKKYFDVAQSIWRFIKTSLIDKKIDGEWFGCLTENLERLPDDDIVNYWKCPYHNTRMITEVIKMFKEEINS